MSKFKDQNIKNAVHVLQEESKALLTLSETIDDSFDAAVEAVHRMKSENEGLSGRFIIAGIGKSGHVARKIAATLASTGTPAFFVHPGEASHGDMGMITKRDVVIMLSNSGENNELSDLIHYTRRYDITLIAMTSNPASTLAQYADIRLILPKVGEVCPHGLAPTTSTTMMMAYGDALAVALLQRMKLTTEQYKVFHPGGKLGQKLMKVSELMVTGDDLPTTHRADTMDTVLLTLTEKNLGAVLVFEDAARTALAGIITDGDLKRHMAPDLLTKTAGDIMTVRPKTIASNALAAEALDVMTKVAGQYLTSLIVTQDDQVIGLVRLQDCLQAGVS